MKKWYSSKTMFINLIGLAIVLVDYFGQLQYIDYQIVVLLLGLFNVILRFITSEPIERKLI